MREYMRRYTYHVFLDQTTLQLEMEQNSVVERKYILPCSYGVFYVQIEDLKLSSVHSSRKAGTIYVLPCQKQISGRVIMFANGKTTW